MSKRKKRQFRVVTFAVVPVLLCLAALVTAFFMTDNKANAMDGSEWTTVRTALNGYITSQFGAGAVEGEYGFVMDTATLHDRIDTDNNGTYLGEGDNAANAPVLIDNLRGNTTIIPATSYRCSWNADCFEATNVATVKGLVDAHVAAGFSTDTVVYCGSGHTEAPTTGAYGFIANASDGAGGYGLSSAGTAIPKVYAFKWGRNGWTSGTIATYGNGGAMGGIETLTGSAPTPLTQCAGATPASDLVRCAARYAVYLTANGGRYSVTTNGTTNLTTIGAAGQSVDIRTGPPATTISTGGGNNNISVPLNTLFDNTTPGVGLNRLDGTATTVIVGRTPMVSGIAAEGVNMLGFNMIDGTFINGGLPGWNNLENEKQVAQTPYSTIAISAYGAPAKVDTSNPTINGGVPAVTVLSGTAVDVARTTSEPATSKIDITNGVTPVHVNSTVLNGTYTTHLTGLEANTHYTGTLAVYDGQANGTSYGLDFWTDVTAPTISSVSPANGSTVNTSGGAPVMSATLADNISGINTDPLVTMVHVDTNMIMSGCTITPTSVSCPTTSLSLGLTPNPHTLEIFTKDLAGNPQTSTTTFTLADDVAPVVTYLTPAGTSNNQSPIITGSVTDPAPSSGLPATGLLSLSNDDGLNWLPTTYPCTISSGDVSCTVTDVLPGDPPVTYTAKIEVTDTASNTGNDTGTFTIDATAPTVTADPLGYQPGNWTNDTTPTVSATITDVPPGQHILDTASVSITGYGSCSAAEINYGDTTLSCTPATPIAAGSHDVTFSAEYTSGHAGVAIQTINVDTTVPVISNLQPSGAVGSTSVTISADLNDGTGSGIAAAASAIYLDGSGTALPGCATMTTSQISCHATITLGPHTFSVYAEDNTGNSTTDTSGSFSLTQQNYYWTWYDNVGGDNWVLAANPNSAAANVYVDMSVAGTPQTLADSGRVIPGEVIAPKFAGVMDGPVKATSTTGGNTILSQRTLWPKGGNSLEEVLATNETDLSDHFWWTWYDEASSGYQDWILIANTNESTDVYYEIKIDNVSKETGTIPAGMTVAPHFPGVMGGPVEVQAWSDGIGGSLPADVMASQRVLSNGGMAFNEMPGIPDSKLTTDYLWTWYDEQSAGARDWVLVSNPSASATVHYIVKVEGIPRAEGDLLPGDEVTPEFAGIIGGPVEVISTGGNVIASQRITWGPSFGEVRGYNVGDLTNDYHWTWYDQSAPGVTNWVLVANPSASATVHYMVKVAGATRAEGDLLPGANVTPDFAGLIGGPVEVTSTGGNVMTSQRVLWKGYFNETLGTVLS